jgi:zinc transport system permease protein
MMGSLYEVPRQFIMQLAESGHLHYTFTYAFVVNGLLCAFVIGPLLGGIGTMVVAKRMAFFSQAVGNAALTGVAIGVVIGESYTAPYFSMFSFCLLFGLFLNFARNRTRMSADTLIGVFLSISLAIGATVLLWVSAKVNTHILDTVMFGSILTVNDTDISVLLVTTVLAAATALPLYNQMLLASLNPSLAHVRGVRVHLLEYVFVVLLTVLTVACVKIVGAVLVEALLLIPAAAARNLNRSVRGFVLWSMLFATVSCCVVGIYAPMRFDLPLPSGGAIILAAALIFLVTMLIRMALPRYREAAF